MTPLLLLLLPLLLPPAAVGGFSVQRAGTALVFLDHTASSAIFQRMGYTLIVVVVASARRKRLASSCTGSLLLATMKHLRCSMSCGAQTCVSEHSLHLLRILL